jgi:hypothetical protein
MQPAAGGAPVQTPSSMVRSSDGKMRIDTPNTTVITNPAAQQAIVLDHLTKQAQVLPLQTQMPQPPQFQMPGAGTPGAPSAPQMPAVTMQDLGKSLIEGHPVDGKRYIVQPPPLPQAPQVPQAPQAPQMPQAPQKPQVPPVPTVSDVWTSTPLNMPVLTQVTTAAGVQTTSCKPAATAEPDPSLFQIPPGYKVLMPKRS